MSYSKECVFGEITLVMSTDEVNPPSDDYYSLSSHAHGHGVSLWVKSTNPATQAVRPIENWRAIKFGTGEWHRAQPPQGYVALCDAPHHETRFLGTPLPKERIACVKETINGKRYVVPGELESVGGWQCVKRPPQIIEKNSTMVAPERAYWAWYKGPFGQEDGERPGEVYVLNLPTLTKTSGTLNRPVIKDPDNIPSEQGAHVDREVTVPCVAVNDRNKSWRWIIANSPTYTLRRRRSYAFVASLDLRNASKDGEISKEVSWGISKTQTQTYRESVGVTIGFEAGVEVEGIGAKVTGSVTQEMGYESSFSNTEMQQQTVKVGGGAAAGKVTAMYAEKHVVYAVRNDPDHTFCSDDDRNVVGFNAGLRYAMCESGKASAKPMWHGLGERAEQAKRDYYDGDVPELIRASDASVEVPRQLTGEPAGADALRG
ncbi:hypothetical protein LG943_05615 [Streptomonospora sp. S1-112]|uniref:Insecticidal crystal toxin domain-containing protein n=1 Tax=Streptomonospora mangrovi TaxID=2883123 RepID=A0A9X3NI22_9ACTN|nr:hypothetical protein [Streptomonospora mangrovi]MDA0563807.1 hypothetical protein [Streptomonospora mangrovi]